MEEPTSMFCFEGEHDIYLSWPPSNGE
jgi:hypothetical protein